jgi:hypothetical protein
MTTFKCGWRCTVCGETRYYAVEIDAIVDEKGGSDIANTKKIQDGSQETRTLRTAEAEEHAERCGRIGIHIFGLHEDPEEREARKVRT